MNENNSKIHEYVNNYIKETTKLIKRGEYRKAINGLDHQYNNHQFQYQYIELIQLYHRMTYCLNKLIYQYLLRENGYTKKQFYIMNRKQIYIFKCWYSIIENYFHHKQLISNKLWFRFIEELQKYLYLQSYLYKLKTKQIMPVFRFISYSAKLTKIYIYFHWQIRLFSIQNILSQLQIAKYYWQKENYQSAIHFYMAVFSSIHDNILLIMRYKSLSKYNEENSVQPMNQNVFHLLVFTLLSLSYIYEHLNLISKHMESLILAYWICQYCFSGEFEDLIDRVYSLYHISQRKYLKTLVEIGEFQKIFSLLFSDKEFQLNNLNSLFRDEDPIDNYFYHKYEHDKLNRNQVILHKTPQEDSNHDSDILKVSFKLHPFTNSSRLSLFNRPRSTVQIKRTNKECDLTLVSYVAQKEYSEDLKQSPPQKEDYSIKSSFTKQISTRRKRLTKPLNDQSSNVYGLIKPEDQNLEFYVGKKVAKRLENDENFYSYDDIFQNSSRELSKEKEDSLNSKSVKSMLNLKKKFANGKLPRKIEKNKVVCPIVVHKKIETSSEHYSGFIKANEYLEEQQKKKEYEEKMKVSDQLILNLKISEEEEQQQEKEQEPIKLNNKKKSLKTMIMHKYSKVLGIKTLRSLDSKPHAITKKAKRPQKQNTMRKRVVDEQELLLDTQKQTRNLLKEMADGYEKEISKATIMQKKKFMKPEHVERLKNSLNSESTKAYQWYNEQNINMNRSFNQSLIKNNTSLAQSTIILGNDKDKREQTIVQFSDLKFLEKK